MIANDPFATRTIADCLGGRSPVKQTIELINVLLLSCG